MLTTNSPLSTVDSVDGAVDDLPGGLHVVFQILNFNSSIIQFVSIGLSCNVYLTGTTSREKLFNARDCKSTRLELRHFMTTRLETITQGYIDGYNKEAERLIYDLCRRLSKEYV